MNVQNQMKDENRNETKMSRADKSFRAVPAALLASLIGAVLLTTGAAATNVFALTGSYNQGFRDGFTGNDPTNPTYNAQYQAGYNAGVAKSTPYTNCEHFDTCGDPKYNPGIHAPYPTRNSELNLLKCHGGC
jgi:hypothetical protein